MDPSVRARAAPPAGTGTLLAGRYRLDQCAGSSAPQRQDDAAKPEQPGGRARSTLWQATDEVLSRPVAVRLVGLRDPDTPRTPGDLPTADELVDTVSHASRAADRRLARIFDVSIEAPDAPDETDASLGVVVSEWVNGRTLAELVRDGPLPVGEAVSFVDAAAAALAAAAVVDVHHGRLHGGNVLICPEGARVTDLAVAALIAGERAGSAEGDARSLGRLFYLALTGVEAPAGRPPSRRPRQLRGGIPRAVDTVAVRLLSREGAPDSAAGVGELLGPLPHSHPDRIEEPLPATRLPAAPSPARRWAWRGIALAALAAVGVGGWLAGTRIGNVHTQRTEVPSISSPSPSAGNKAALTPVSLRNAPIRAFDPQGDGEENDDAARLAVDQDRSTSWTTVNYHGSPVFGGLKHGVGLLIDLGKSTRVRQVRLAFDTPGASVQVRAADRPATSASAYPIVARKDSAGRTATLRPRGTTARYWLVWLTRLPKNSDGEYSEGIAEIRFYR